MAGGPPGPGVLPPSPVLVADGGSSGGRQQEAGAAASFRAAGRLAAVAPEGAHRRLRILAELGCPGPAHSSHSKGW